MKRVGRWILTVLVLYVFAAVSVRVAPTPAGWEYELVWGIVIAFLLFLLWRQRRKS
jgi:hypothetical protein